MSTLLPQPWNSIVPICTQASRPLDVVEIEIILGMPVLLLDRDLLHVRAERALVVLLEEAFAGAAAGTADQGHRPVRRIDHDQRLDRRVIIGEILLGQAELGEDHAFGAADFDAEVLAVASRFALGFVCFSRLLQMLGHFAHDLLRRLVLAQPNEARVPQDAVVGELGEGDFGDELRLDPVRALAVGARHLDRRLVDRERLHPLHQLLDQLGVEAGADLADIGELAAVLRRQQQRAEAAALVAFRPADDDEFLALDAFDLEPVAGARAAVGRARLLRDDALAALLADRVEHLLAAADDMVAVEDRRRHAFEQGREPLLALDIGQLADVLAAVDQQVEGVEGEVAPF